MVSGGNDRNPINKERIKNVLLTKENVIWKKITKELVCLTITVRML